MSRRETPIRRQLITVTMLTATIVIVMVCSAFVVYEYLNFRRSALANIETLAEIVAANSTAALAFVNPEDAEEILAALQAESQIEAAALYDSAGTLFASYPPDAPAALLPAAVAESGFRFGGWHLAGFEPVTEGGNRPLGTLYLRSDLSLLYERFQLYAVIVALILGASLLVAYLISQRLQQRISRPILALAETARAISGRRDYSVRAEPAGGEELALLTDAFNQMLAEIQTQNEALLDNEQRLRTVVNASLSAVVLMDRHGRIVDWNARAESIFGWARNEVLGRGVAELIVPERLRTRHSEGLHDYLASGEARVLDRLLEQTAVHRDGHEFPVELFISQIGSGDNVTFCGFITDITSRREAQARVQSQLGRLHLLQRITRAIAERQDLESIFKVVVDVLEEQMPVDFAAVLLGSGDSASFTVNTMGVAAGLLDGGPPYAADEPVAATDIAPDRRVPHELWYLPSLETATAPLPRRLARAGLNCMVAAPLVVDGGLVGIMLVGRRAGAGFDSTDCEFLRQLSEHVALASHAAQLNTDLQRAYDDLRLSQNRVLQQERLKALGQMASGIAHDINNAISPISLYAESLLESERSLSPQSRQNLETIYRAIQDVANTVTRMREFGRPRDTEPALEAIDVNELAREVTALTQARWQDLPQQRGVTIDMALELGGDLPRIRGAASEIRDALTNLIFNAVDAMPDGGRLTLRTRRRDGDDPASGGEDRAVADDAGQPVVIEVQDSGTGMSEETRKRCLEPFFTTKGNRGTGLGLASVYGMVQRHRARMEIDSGPDVGTTVRLLLPAARTGVARESGAPVPELPRRTHRLLIVDDDPLVLSAIDRTLRHDGHSVDTAADGREAIAKFEAAIHGGTPYSAAITDLGMPQMDGRMVAAAFKQADPQIPVLLLTGWGQQLSDAGRLPPHIDGILSKPPRLKDLRAALERLIPLADAQDET